MLKHLINNDEFNEMTYVEKGFTLVELLVVIVILGILAAIVVFAVGNSTGKAKSNACASEYKTVEAAIEAYNADQGHYPAAGASTDLVGVGGTGHYLRDIPKYWDVGANGLVVTTASNPTGNGGTGVCSPAASLG